MFVENKYTRIYFEIVKKYGTDAGEKHHIIPKSLGGTNKKENLVIVPPRVHFILHKLLCFMVKEPKHLRSMNFALFQMMNRKICEFTSRDYEKVRKAVKEQMQKQNPMHKEETAARFRKKRPEQSKIAAQRNKEYWAVKGRPIRNFDCPICQTPITTRLPTKKVCSKVCADKLKMK